MAVIELTKNIGGIETSDPSIERLSEVTLDTGKMFHKLISYTDRDDELYQANNSFVYIYDVQGKDKDNGEYHYALKIGGATKAKENTTPIKQTLQGYNNPFTGKTSAARPYVHVCLYAELMRGSQITMYIKKLPYETIKVFAWDEEVEALIRTSHDAYEDAFVNRYRVVQGKVPMCNVQEGTRKYPPAFAKLFKYYKALYEDGISPGIKGKLAKYSSDQKKRWKELLSLAKEEYIEARKVRGNK